jgi:hypothetical protein
MFTELFSEGPKTVNKPPSIRIATSRFEDYNAVKSLDACIKGANNEDRNHS